MTTVNQLPETLQWLFGQEANRLGRETGFIERERVWTGATFAQTLVFGWMEAPNASLSQLQQMAHDCGCQVSVKNIATRLKEVEATRFMQRLLETGLAVATQTRGREESTPLPFARVVLLDSTQVSLPRVLAQQWPGGGNQNQVRAGMKIQAFYEWLEGQLAFTLHPAVANDRKLPLTELEPGSLVVHDSGFLSVARCRHLEQQDLYWLARVSAQMGVVDPQGRHWLLAHYLAQHATQSFLDHWVELTHQRHPIRLLALRLPDTVVQVRQERLRADCLRRNGRPPSAESLALCQWCVLATNAPNDLLSFDQALLLYRSRWQIELLFKLWKQHGCVDEWRTRDPQRIQTELFAKLLMLLVQHWLLVETCWQFVDRSLVKATRCLRRRLGCLVKLLNSPAALRSLLSDIEKGMTHCRLSKRRRRPAFFQLVDAFLDSS